MKPLSLAKVGIGAIDVQHQGILEALDKAISLITGNGDSAAAANEFQNAFTLFKSHIKYEDTLLSKSSYPGADRQSKAHQDLVKAFEAARLRFKASNSQECLEAVNGVRNIFLAHVAGPDCAYCEFLQNCCAQ